MTPERAVQLLTGFAVRPDGFGGVYSTPGGRMPYQNQNNLAQNYTECANAASPENMVSVLNCLNEFAKSARQRVRDIEARLLGQPNAVGKEAGDTKLQAVQSVADVITETRALVGQTLDSLDRIQAQL